MHSHLAYQLIVSAKPSPQVAVGLERWKAIIYYVCSSVVILFFLTIAAIIIVLVLTAVLRAVVAGAAGRYAQYRGGRARLRPDGTPYPPVGRGMCDRCARPFENVYHLPSGKRLCPACYHNLYVSGQLGAYEDPPSE